MSPVRFGEDLARLVWESFSDFVTDGSASGVLGDLGHLDEEGVPGEKSAEEILIFLMWAHTRAVQLAFLSRVPESKLREGLDALHRAVFEDMIKHGTPANQIPVFEQRVGARYQEYSAASDKSDEAVGLAVIGHLGERGEGDLERARAIASEAIAVVGPLRDYLEDVDLGETPPSELPT
jgi:hypothetical protein